ncbi:MC family transporter: adenylate [Ostreococcus lucimarinus CCE9901]|uniref:MC family transporter: adenylate n=1 Tax=Ostreococcus lucimarinus (strain CCE9901) TaxID=436017 RepID=A4S5A1_OSTLU|nr:MC family transporter: adenylate [Ostreococcus lucimarinus CCE9901]ABO99031.1 MC family transporter: adenylate [Ostreococcus lucimarinus CCE9901]|eukprot:XP_001420738.1 MC family transporter: adenylate [Ostreococcus lucimarinus CCE9901]
MARSRVVDAPSSTSRDDAPSSTTNASARFVAGCASGAVSRIATQPLEVRRLRVMTGRGSNESTSLRAIYRTEGASALFAGTKASVARHAPAKGLNFLVFGAVKEALRRARAAAGTSTSNAARASDALISGAVAGLSSLALLYPLDSLLVRQATGGPSAATLGLGRGLRKIFRDEGARGLYRGALPAAIAVVPEAAITFGSYDLMRDWYGRRAKSAARSAAAAAAPSLAFGMISAACGQAVSFPLDVVSRRMVVERGGFLAVARALFRDRGLRGFYAGLRATTVKTIPMSSLSFFAYECAMRALAPGDA